MISFRVGIPLLIVVVTAGLAAYTVERDRNSAEAVVRGDAASQLMSRMVDWQRRFELADLHGGTRAVEDEIRRLRGSADLELAVITNADNVIDGTSDGKPVQTPLIQSAQADDAGWAGEPLAVVAERVRRQRSGEVHLANAGRMIVGVYPLKLGASTGDTGEELGVLVVQKNLTRDLARARHAVEGQSIEMVAALGCMAVALGILVHLALTRRLHVLVNAARQLAGGNLGARARLKGVDEVAVLGRAFDQMAVQVADTHRFLEARVQERTAELDRLVSTLKTEILERRRAETALSEEKDRIQITLSSLGDGVITADVHGNVEYLNPVAEKLTGWTKDQASGKSLDEIFKLVDEVTDEPLTNPINRCLSEGSVVHRINNTLLIRPDGQGISIDETAAPIFDSTGRVIGAVLVVRDVTDARRAARRLSYYAAHDALTGLVNRREFERRLERILATAAIDESHAVLYLDLDQFKVVNDTCGHAAGDELLRQIGVLLTPQVRKRDTLARLGGDEFGVLLEHCLPEQALRIACEVRDTLQDFRFVWQDRSFAIGASIGLVPINPGVDSVGSVFQAADSACYAAKEQGRNRVHVYQPDDQDVAQRHGEMQWVPRIQEALAEDRFVLFYQPIVPLNGGGHPHGEVLLRLRNRAGELVPPTAFIPAAERYNQMLAVDRWVVKTVFNLMAKTQKVPADYCLAINLSGQSLSDRHFLDYVEQQIAATHVCLERVCFEITETAAISNLSHAARFFGALKPRGCRFALDDFGSGLSSFAYLKTIPVDFLKIDGSFVKDLAKDPIDYAMVEAIHRIGHVMGIETIAEFVESDSVIAGLRSIGVDYAQGNLLAEPIPLWTD